MCVGFGGPVAYGCVRAGGVPAGGGGASGAELRMKESSLLSQVRGQFCPYRIVLVWSVGECIERDSPRGVQCETIEAEMAAAAAENKAAAEADATIAGALHQPTES